MRCDLCHELLIVNFCVDFKCLAALSCSVWFSEIAKAFYGLHGDSEEKYEEFQVNSQLRYTCASCRDECYKVHVSA